MSHLKSHSETTKILAMIQEKKSADVTLIHDVHSRKLCAWEERNLKFSLLSDQSFCKPQTHLKNKAY